MSPGANIISLTFGCFRTPEMFCISQKKPQKCRFRSRHNGNSAPCGCPGKSVLYRLYERKISLDEIPDLYVQIVTEKRQDRELLERFYENLLLAFPVVLVLSLLCGMFAANKPRRIIKNIARVAGRITSRTCRSGFPCPPARDEVRELTLTINSMIERLEKSFAEIKQFTADVSHELRNPLFALKGTMEVALAGSAKPANTVRRWPNAWSASMFS